MKRNLGKKELKGRKGTEGFEDPQEAVADDPLQYLPETVEQIYGPKVAGLTWVLPGFGKGMTIASRQRRGKVRED